MRASSARGVSRNSENAYFNHGLLSKGPRINKAVALAALVIFTVNAQK
jgi:hypothetical protein